MKKASKILYLVGAILSILAALGFFFWGIASIVLGAIGASYSASDIYHWIVENAPELAESLNEKMIAEFFATAIVNGVIDVIWACCSVASAVLAFKARKEELPSRVLAILNIVFGVLGCGLANAVAGVFSLVIRAKEPQAE